MINFSSTTNPTTLRSSAPKLAETEVQLLQSAIDQMAALDQKYMEADRLKYAVKEAARNYALGKIELELAVNLAGISHEEITATTAALRSAVKGVQRDILESMTPLIRKHRQHATDELAAKCSKFEKAERENARNVGISDDDYRPSGLLERLREQHLRTKNGVQALVSRTDLNALAEACGIAVPPTPETEPRQKLKPFDLTKEVGTGEL